MMTTAASPAITEVTQMQRRLLRTLEPAVTMPELSEAGSMFRLLGPDSPVLVLKKSFNCRYVKTLSPKDHDLLKCKRLEK